VTPLRRIAATHPLKRQESRMLNLDVGDRGSIDIPCGVGATARAMALLIVGRATPDAIPRIHRA